MSSPASLLRDILLAHSASEITDPEASGGVEDWACHVGSMPDSNDTAYDKCVCLYDSPDGRERRRINSGHQISAFGVQLRVRSSDYLAGWEKIRAICDQLETVNYETVQGLYRTHVVQSVDRTSPPASIGAEPGNKRRENFTANFLVTYEETTAS